MESLLVEMFQKGASDCGAVAFLAPSGSGPSAPFELASFFPARSPGLLPWGLHASGPGMGESSLVPWPASVRPRFSGTVWAEPRAGSTPTPGASAPSVAAPQRAQNNIHSRLCVITLLHTQLERRPLLRADTTAADNRGCMGSRYELRWSVLGARDLKKSLETIESHLEINENRPLVGRRLRNQKGTMRGA